jgi:hypothetical protein
MADDVPDGLAHALRGRFGLAGTDLGELLAEPSRRREQEVARAAGRVEAADGEQGVLSERPGE